MAWSGAFSCLRCSRPASTAWPVGTRRRRSTVFEVQVAFCASPGRSRHAEPVQGASKGNVRPSCSPWRSRQARRSRRRTILPACSRTRRSFHLGRHTQLLRLNRRMMPNLSGPRTQSTRWTIIAMGSPPAFFAVWRESGGRTPSAITLAATRRCGRPMSDWCCASTGWEWTVNRRGWGCCASPARALTTRSRRSRLCCIERDSMVANNLVFRRSR
jgi:hypothetical protein